MSDIAPGSRVGTQFGPYQLRRLLGRGGMGEVYEAQDTVKDRVVALKLMTQELSSDPVFRQRMQREAHTAGRLQEPHIVPIHDYGEIDGQLFIDMRFIEGIDVSTLLRAGPLTPPRAVAIVEQVAAALDAAHRAGVIHRDVKPENILITGNDFAYLVDFGIAAAATDQHLTKTGAAMGTWNYMAPERFGNEAPTYRADIYALTCVLYECLTGATPYETESLPALMAAHLTQPIPHPSRRNPAVPGAFDEVIARGMAKDPADRHVTAGDLAQAAHHALSAPEQQQAADLLKFSQQHAPPHSGPFSHAWAPPPPPPTRGASRRTWLILGAAVIAVVVVMAGIGIINAVGDNPRPTAGPTATASTTATTTVPIVAPAQVNSILLGPPQINTILGVSGIQAGATTTTMEDASDTISVEDCRGALNAVQEAVYGSSGYTTIKAQLLHEPGQRAEHNVVQGVVVFGSADQARGFVQLSAPKWKSCAGQTVTQGMTGSQLQWKFGDFAGNPPRIAIPHTLLGAPASYSCEHMLSAVANVVLDVAVCGTNIVGSAAQITDALAANVAK